MALTQAEAAAQAEADAKKRAGFDAQYGNNNAIADGGGAFKVPGGKELYEKLQAEATGVGREATTFRNPGATEYGGIGAQAYKDSAMGHMYDNDAAQAANRAGMAGSFANMTTDRGMMSKENADLSAREDASRNTQLDAANLNMQAAMGNAPSEASYNTRLGMDQVAAGASGAAGSARGLAGLGGAQMAGAQAAAGAGSNLAYAGGLGRSKEVTDAMGQYGMQAGQIRGQDLTRLGMSNQNALFNAELNDSWKLGNAGVLAGQAGLGNKYSNIDQQWFGQAMQPDDIQFQFDQEAAGWQAGADIDAAAMKYQKDVEGRQNTQALAGGVAQAGLTALGSMAGPAGAAVGGMAGSAINSSTRKYY